MLATDIEKLFDAKPETSEKPEERGVRYAIRIPANDSLERDIEELLTRPVGRPSHKPVIRYKSFLYQAESWKAARRVVAKVEFHFGELFFRVGFIVTNLETDKEITKLFEEFCNEYGEEPEMYFEPGRFVVGESGKLPLHVNTLEENHGRNIADTDSGFGHLIGPVLYGAYHEILNLTNPDGKKKKCDAAGNICETGDCFAADRMLREISEGDLLAINNAGAYCYSMGSVYNLRALPKEVLVLHGGDRVVRKGLTDEELVAQVLGESR